MFVAGAVGCGGCDEDFVVALVGGWNCLVTGGGVDWSWWGCGIIAVHDIDDYWGAIGVGSLDGEFLLLLVVHSVVVGGGWLNTVERVGGDFA